MMKIEPPPTLFTSFHCFPYNNFVNKQNKQTQRNPWKILIKSNSSASRKNSLSESFACKLSTSSILYTQQSSSKLFDGGIVQYFINYILLLVYFKIVQLCPLYNSCLVCIHSKISYYYNYFVVNAKYYTKFLFAIIC